MSIQITDKLHDIFEKYSYAEDYFEQFGLTEGGTYEEKTMSFQEYVESIEMEILEDLGMEREYIYEDFLEFVDRMEKIKIMGKSEIESLTLIGGRNKSGEKEIIDRLILQKGEVVCIVGPTGSGKSRLLEDIECLAQKDTPTGRKILINGEVPDIGKRFSIENRLVAQLSQNMNFVMDLSVEKFVKLHTESRMIGDSESIVEEIIKCANELAGEPFDRNTPLTQLSGGQSRALMIADTALLSLSPIVLIDEIENAGIDRRKAVELLVKEEKIVLISTHDPVLALIGDKRIVIKNGGIDGVIESTDEERENIKVLERVDRKMLEIRNRIRAGERIDRKSVVFDFEY